MKLRLAAFPLNLLLAFTVALGGLAPIEVEAKPGSPPPTLNRQKQNSHVPGTAEHLNRVKQGKGTSTFFGAKSGEAFTKKTWETGTPVAGRPQLRERSYTQSVGQSPTGGMQKTVRVAVNKRGEIHGYPSGKEFK